MRKEGKHIKYQKLESKCYIFSWPVYVWVQRV